jgi:integrase
MSYSDHAIVELSTTARNRTASFHEAHSIFDDLGRRKYLTRTERAAFLRAAQKAPAKVRSLCTILAYTGCRLSEALATTPERVDADAGVIVFETLKRRRTNVFRSIPIPENLAMQLRSMRRLGPSRRLWPWSRTTAWRRIKEVLAAAGVTGPHASPKGLRHAFGVLALQDGVPLTSVSRWLGHARLSTTAIYANAVGEEDRAFARKFWNGF